MPGTGRRAIHGPDHEPFLALSASPPSACAMASSRSRVACWQVIAARVRELHRDHRMYEWTGATPIAIGSAEASQTRPHEGLTLLLLSSRAVAHSDRVAGYISSAVADVAGCFGCGLYAGRRFLPGGVVHQTAAWVVNHVIGPMNLETLVLAPKDHVVAVADLGDTAAAELGVVLRRVMRDDRPPADARQVQSADCG
jgi:hypothetical protein